MLVVASIIQNPRPQVLMRSFFTELPLQGASLLALFYLTWRWCEASLGRDVGFNDPTACIDYRPGSSEVFGGGLRINRVLPVVVCGLAVLEKALQRAFDIRWQRAFFHKLAVESANGLPMGGE